MPLRRHSSIITVVSGLPRSGTSLVMKMLESGGITPLTDGVRSADIDNPKGYYEYEPVKKLRTGENQWLKQARGKVVKIITAHLVHLPDNHNFKVILVKRDLEEVLESQRKMLMNRGNQADGKSDHKLKILFTEHIEQTISWMSTKDHFMKYLIIDYNQLLDTPTPIIFDIDNFLGRKLDVDAMKTVIDPALYRNRR